MWELDHKEGRAPNNSCFWTVVLEKTLESPLDCKEIKAVNPKGNQYWIFIGRIDVEAEAPILWPPDSKSLLIRKDPDYGKDWRQEGRGTTEDEMVGWHHRLNGHEIWASFRWWWGTGKPGVLQSMGSQRVAHNWVIEQQQQSHLQELNSVQFFQNLFPASLPEFYCTDQNYAKALSWFKSIPFLQSRIHSCRCSVLQRITRLRMKRLDF